MPNITKEKWEGKLAEIEQLAGDVELLKHQLACKVDRENILRDALQKSILEHMSPYIYLDELTDLDTVGLMESVKSHFDGFNSKVERLERENEALSIQIEKEKEINQPLKDKILEMTMAMEFPYGK